MIEYKAVKDCILYSGTHCIKILHYIIFTTFYPSKTVLISVKNWGCCSNPSFSWLGELCGRHNIGGLDISPRHTARFPAVPDKRLASRNNRGDSWLPWLFHNATLLFGIAENCAVCLGLKSSLRLYILLLFLHVNICVEETQRKPQYGIESNVVSF